MKWLAPHEVGAALATVKDAMRRLRRWSGELPDHP